MVSVILSSLAVKDSPPSSILLLYESKIKNKSFSNKNFLIYCSGEGCSLSEDLGFYLYNELDIKKILIYEGGIPEWLDNGYPVKND